MFDRKENANSLQLLALYSEMLGFERNRCDGSEICHALVNYSRSTYRILVWKPLRKQPLA